MMRPPTHGRTVQLGPQGVPSPGPQLPPSLSYLTGPPARLRSFCCAPRAKAAGALPVPTCLRREDSQGSPHLWGPTTPCITLQKASDHPQLTLPPPITPTQGCHWSWCCLQHPPIMQGLSLLNTPSKQGCNSTKRGDNPPTHPTR